MWSQHTQRHDKIYFSAGMLVKTPLTTLRLLCATDCYDPKQFSKLKTLRSRCQATEGMTKVLFAGDFCGGSFLSVITKGESMIHVFNDIGFDYVTYGNHEFDYGATRASELVALSNFKWLGSNVRSSSDSSLFDKTLDFDFFDVHGGSGTYRVGIFGLVTQETPKLTSLPPHELTFEDVVIHAKRCASLLRDTHKCHFIIAMTHVSLATDKLIAEIDGVDLIIGGHDHEPMVLTHRNKRIIKAGQNVEHLGIIDLSFEKSPTGETIVDHSLQLLSTRSTPTDPAVDAIIHHWSSLSQGVMEGDDEVLCVVEGDDILSTLTSDVRTRETAFVCHIADALMWTFKELGLQCDFALQNGGFVRRNMVYRPGESIMVSTIAEELPFPRTAFLLAMTGEDVCRGLHQMLPRSSSSGPLGSFPHLSQGISVAYSFVNGSSGGSDNAAGAASGGTESGAGAVAGAVAGEVVVEGRRLCVKVHGAPIVMDREYRVGISGFYVRGDGDGVTAFLNQQVLREHDQSISVMMTDYLRAQGRIDGSTPGRLTFLR